METPLALTLEELLKQTEQRNQGAAPAMTPTPAAPRIPTIEAAPAKPTLNELVVETQKRAPKPPATTSLTVDDVVNDPERLAKIRKMMSTTKDVYFETAPAEEVMESFMSHMRWLNTNEVSTAREALNITVADEDTKAIYGEAYKIYDEMGSMFSNGDAWNGMLDYGGAFVTSPSLWLGVGIGKIAGSAGTKAAAKVATSAAINAATKQVAQKVGGTVATQAIKNELKNTAAKAAARYHIGGALAAEAPMAAMQDYFLQDMRMDTGVQDEYDFMQGAIATMAGGVGAIPGIYTLRRSSNSTFAETGQLLDESFKQRARTSAKRIAPEVAKSLEKAQADWLKLAEAGIGFESNVPLQNAVLDWFFDVEAEDSLVRILQREGADLSFEEGAFTRDMLRYAFNLGDESLNDFNEAFKPLGVTFGEATEILANTVRRGGQTLRKPSIASRFFKDMRNVSVAKSQSAKSIVENATEEAADDVELSAGNVVGYAQSVWKKMLVSTFPTTAVNVKGWAIARSASAMADIALAGGLMGRAGIRAVIDPAGALKDVAKVRALAQNQTFALQTLVDPFLSAEAFIALLEKAPTKVKKSMSGQIFGGVDDFGPERFGLNPNSKTVSAIEKTSDIAQRISLVHAQDTLTKGVSGLTALDRESRIAFGKGIQQLIEDGEVWKLTDEMWNKATTSVLRETFSEDLSMGKGFLAGAAKFVQNLSATPGIGFIVPFGKFLNNTVAFTYRHSPLAYLGVAGRVFKGAPEDDIAETAARATVGTMALAYLVAGEEEKQKEGLQWFERRNDDGSIEDITTVFPYSVYSLIGRMYHNWDKGEGMDKGLVDSLLQQIGPLDALETVAAPPFIRDFTRYMTDETIDDGEKATFFATVKDALGYVAGTTGDILAGYTRPLDLMSRTISYTNPVAGGGLTIDRKQAEGIDKFTLGLTRYTSAFFNYAFGEENEYGVRMMGRPKESAISPGPVRIPNPAGTIVGTTLPPKANKINKLLGMVDKPPYMADSFTSGNPEYDAFINKTITPMLEERAARLLKNEVFLKAPQSAKSEIVNDMIQETRREILGLLEGGRIGDSQDRLNNERRKLLVGDRGARRRAMKALGITTDEHKLSLFEIEAIKRRMDLEEDEFERIK